ncbi:MAG: MbcA/ParS/Xre antitoxin family protein [Flavobacteriaceae bacterium]|nr:MbcA/ParS/Xre antitoxin family protein [Flavobacteriaceae bacterium]
MLSQKQEYKNFQKDVNTLVKDVATIYRSGNIKKNMTYKDFLNDKLLIVHSIRKGIRYSFFNKIKQTAPFSDLDWSIFLNISTKSLQRYKNESNYIFKPIHSEKIIELAEVIVFGNDVFDNIQNFYSWLKSPSIVFSNMTPIELLKDSYGKEMVMEELNRIDHGVFV